MGKENRWLRLRSVYTIGLFISSWPLNSNIKWAETEIKRDIQRINVDDCDECYCSFCGKPLKKVQKMIAGTDVYICDECVALCGEILEEEMETDGETEK